MNRFLSTFSLILIISIGNIHSEQSSNEIAEQLLELGFDVYRVTNAGDNVLHSAVKKKNLEAVKLSIDFGVPVSRANKAGDTPLHIAAAKGDLIISKYLIECGADLSITNNLSQTPYHKSLTIKDTDLMNYFIQVGYQPGDPTEDLLIAMGLNPNHIDNGGNSILHRVAKSKNLVLMRKLLEEGYSPYTWNKKEETPLTIAVKAQDSEMVVLLAEFQHDETALADIKDLKIAIKSNWLAGVELLFAMDRNQVCQDQINSHDDKGIALIHYACTTGNFEIIELLVNLGADINLLTSSEYYHNPNDPCYWSDDDWDTFGELGNDIDRYSEGSGYVHPVVSPLTIIKRLHPNHASLIEFLVSLDATEHYESSVKNESVEEYLK